MSLTLPHKSEIKPTWTPNLNPELPDRVKEENRNNLELRIKQCELHTERETAKAWTFIGQTALCSPVIGQEILSERLQEYKESHMEDMTKEYNDGKEVTPKLESMLQEYALDLSHHHLVQKIFDLMVQAKKLEADLDKERVNSVMFRGELKKIMANDRKRNADLQEDVEDLLGEEA